MKFFLEKYLILIILIFAIAMFTVAVFNIHHKDINDFESSLEIVKNNKAIRLITNYSNSTFYLDHGKAQGFEYELAKEFANYLGVELDVITPGWNNMLPYLNSGQGDFIGASLTITRDRLDKVNYSIPYMNIQQRLIHHQLVLGPNSVNELAYNTIHVRRGTSYSYRLGQLKNKGIDLNYILHDNIATEDLIQMVANRQIKYTVADSNIAFQSRRYYPDIIIGVPIHEKESLAWAVRLDDTKLQHEINRFFLFAFENGIIQLLKEKYYGNIEDFDFFELKKFHERIKTRLPRYKDFIMKESDKYGLDWRLVASVIYQESHFNPNARSFTNVRGLMQVTIETAKEMGVHNRLKPEQSIKAGIKYLNKMYNKFDNIDDDYQRMLFALASYNIGYGHVKDAQKIAVKKGYDEKKWKTLKEMLPLLTKPQYYRYTKHGYARGWEPIQYVERILTYYDILKKKTMS